VPIAEDLIRYAVRLAAASRPSQPNTPDLARALLAGRNHATTDDIRALVHPTLRHRILVGYRAEAEGITVERVIDRLLEHVTP
jgi:MoxR-like ATPase